MATDDIMHNFQVLWKVKAIDIPGTLRDLEQDVTEIFSKEKVDAFRKMRIDGTIDYFTVALKCAGFRRLVYHIQQVYGPEDKKRYEGILMKLHEGNTPKKSSPGNDGSASKEGGKPEQKTVNLKPKTEGAAAISEKQKFREQFEGADKHNPALLCYLALERTEALPKDSKSFLWDGCVEGVFYREIENVVSSRTGT